MYLVSVYFDEKTNRILNRYIRIIAEKTGNTFMTGAKRISIAMYVQFLITITEL